MTPYTIFLAMAYVVCVLLVWSTSSFMPKPSPRFRHVAYGVIYGLSGMIFIRDYVVPYNGSEVFLLLITTYPFCFLSLYLSNKLFFQKYGIATLSIAAIAGLNMIGLCFFLVAREFFPITEVIGIFYILLHSAIAAYSIYLMEKELTVTKGYDL